MPDTTITIDRERRDGLYELVRNHLGAIEDFWVALERTKDFATAERLGREFAEDFRLLQDIGWSEDASMGESAGPSTCGSDRHRGGNLISPVRRRFPLPPG